MSSREKKNSVEFGASSHHRLGGQSMEDQETT